MYGWLKNSTAGLLVHVDRFLFCSKMDLPEIIEEPEAEDCVAPKKAKIEVIEKLITEVNHNDQTTSTTPNTTVSKDKTEEVSQDEEVTTPLSKKQQKKLRKAEQWEGVKKLKRLKEREKYKLKRKEALEKGLPTRTGPSRKALKRNKVEQSSNFLRVAIDLEFDDLMTDRDISKCVKQCLRIYTINRRSQQPCKLFLTGITQEGKIHECFKKNDGYENWDLEWHFKPHSEVFQKDKIVYLTSDSDEVLEKLEEDTTYIIGGIVDHNHHKGLCFDRAQKNSLKTARLPLNENVDMKTRSVLSTYHVFELMLKVSQGKNWTDAILDTIPMRKGAKPKTEEQS